MRQPLASFGAAKQSILTIVSYGFRARASRAPRNDDGRMCRNSEARAPRSRGAIRPRFDLERCPPNKQRAQGRPGARCTRGLVCKIVRRNAHEHTGSAETLRPSPRNGFTTYIALSLATGLSCHHRLTGLDRTRLDASVGASGPHDFAVRVSAVRQRRISVHRIPPHVRDDREPPLSSGETGELIALICPTG